jgi:hypothetical protein
MPDLYSEESAVNPGILTLFISFLLCGFTFKGRLRIINSAGPQPNTIRETFLGQNGGARSPGLFTTCLNRYQNVSAPAPMDYPG